MISGAIAGLGTITPASGFVAPWHGLLIGLIAGGFCFWACTELKRMLGYDDSLDVFGVHGIGGFTGTLLAGVFAVNAIGETPGLIEGNAGQMLYQVYGIVATIVWSGVLTFVILKVIEFMVPLRVTPAERDRRARHHPARRVAAVAPRAAIDPARKAFPAGPKTVRPFHFARVMGSPGDLRGADQKLSRLGVSFVRRPPGRTATGSQPKQKSPSHSIDLAAAPGIWHGA